MTFEELGERKHIEIDGSAAILQFELLCAIFDKTYEGSARQAIVLGSEDLAALG
jgi:uncharacterized protein (UPF0218 family)